MIQDRLGHAPLAWNGDGIIATLRSDPVSFRSISALMRRGIPLVDLTISRPDIKVPRVTSDHMEIGRLAARHFIEHHFQHVAWFSTSWGYVHQLRYRGLQEILPKKPSKWIVVNELPIRRQNDWSSFINWFRSRFSESDKPLAVLAYDETDAARLLYAAKELRINVPEELAILSIGNNPLICENQSVPLSSIGQNLERGGYEAAALLDRLMSRSRPSTPTILIPPAGVVTRRSTNVIAVSDEIVRLGLSFICNNLEKSIGSPQIADALGCRRVELDRRFRANLGHSVGEEIRRRRFAQVKLMLETTRDSISTIAKATGYCTPSHLTNAFKAYFGLTPKAWREARLPT